jgi:hypothetical protein
MDFPKNQTELYDLLQQYAAQQFVGQLDPRTRIEISETMEIACPNSADPWGFNGNGAKFNWVGRGGDDILRFVGTEGTNSRGLTVERVVIDGNGYGGAPAGTCLKLSAPLGDYGPIYKFTLRDVFCNYATKGFVFEGGVYEGAGYNLHAENNNEEGILMQHLNLGQPGQGVVSNIYLFGPNMSRNLGAGIHSVYSVNIFGGSFVLNGAGGVVAPDGLRSAIGGNGENTGEALFKLGYNGYGSVIDNWEASSNGTIARKWDGSQWIDVGKPMLYVLDGGGDKAIACINSHCTWYGGGSDPMRVVR